MAESNETQNAKQALQAAKERAHNKTANKNPAMQIQMVAGHGEGRATREFEVIWWTDLFFSHWPWKVNPKIVYSKVLHFIHQND